MNNDEIRRNYERETGHAYERPPVEPLPGMSRPYWYGMAVIIGTVSLVYVWISLFTH